MWHVSYWHTNYWHTNYWWRFASGVIRTIILRTRTEAFEFMADFSFLVQEIPFEFAPEATYEFVQEAAFEFVLEEVSFEFIIPGDS